MSKNNQSFVVKVLAMLNKAKSIANIKADIKAIEPRLPKIKLQGILNKAATKKNLDADLKGASSKVKIDADTTQAEEKIKDIEKQKTDTTITPKVDDAQMVSGLKQTQKKTATLWKNLGSAISTNLIRMGVQKVIQSISGAVSTVRELDSVLTDLKKTTQMSASELKNFYYSANDTAKQTGVTTKEILEQAAVWSRLGFSTADATAKMAKYSSMFAVISPGMSIDSATDGLATVMKAFKIGLQDADEVVDGIISKINIIGSTHTVNNSDIVSFLTSSSHAMSEADNTLEDTIALGTAMAEITGDIAGAGQALNTVSMRIRGYDEETGMYIGNVEALSDKIADLTKTASAPGGISLFSNEAETQFKSTRQLLQEISEIYDQLTAESQSELLDALAGNQNGKSVAAVLNNFDIVTSSLESMAASAGNAEAEMAGAMDTIDYKLNKVKETGTGIAQNLFGSDDMKSILDAVSTLGNSLEWLTSKLGLLGTISAGAGLFAGIKNVGAASLY